MAEYINRAKLEFDFEQCNGRNSKWTPQRVSQMIHRQSTEDVAPVVHGRWVEKQGGFWETATCSNCGEKCPTVGIIPHYCPNCGARMNDG